jgi:hypothetical protein
VNEDDAEENFLVFRHNLSLNAGFAGIAETLSFVIRKVRSAGSVSNFG